MKSLFSMLFTFAVLLSNSQISNWKWAKGYSSYGTDSGIDVAIDASGNVISIGSLHSWSLSCGNTTLYKNGNYLDFVVMKHDPNGNLLWAQSFGGTSDDNAYAVTADANDNIYIGGSYSSSLVTFGSYTVSSNNAFRSFLLKLSPTGTVLWVKTSSGQKSMPGTSAPSCFPLAVAADKLGNVCMVGMYNTSAICFGTFTLTQQSLFQAFIVKYDSNGNELWVTGPTGMGSLRPESAAFDPSGNVLITGYINVGNVGMSLGSYSFNNLNSIKCIIAKCDVNGNVLWATVPSGSATTRGNSISCDINRNVIVSGECKGSSTFGQISVSTASYSPMLLKADSLGNYLWVTTAGGPGSGAGVDVDLNSNIIWTGRFDGYKNTLTFGNISVAPTGNYPVFITRYDANGNALCADYIGCGLPTTRGLALNSSGDAFLCSQYSVDPFIVGNDTLHIQKQTSYSQGHYIAKWNCGSSITATPEIQRKNLTLFPVPVEHYLNIDIDNPLEYSTSQLTVKNIQGQVVVSTSFSAFLDCSSLISGVYFLELYSESGESYRGKFIKQ